jgi:hypothetical protein
MWHDAGYVFATPTGKPIDPRNDHRAWRQLLRDAGVRPARLHDARHTAATLLLAQGVAPRVAMQILGHSQISLTLGTYSHVVPELAAEAAASMGDALWGPSDSPAPELAANLAASKIDDLAGGTTEDEERPLTCDDTVGRLGIEPRTRGLKGGSRTCRTMMANDVRWQTCRSAA